MIVHISNGGEQSIMWNENTNEKIIIMSKRRRICSTRL